VTDAARSHCLAQHAKDHQESQEQEFERVPDGNENDQVQPTGSTRRRPPGEEMGTYDEPRCHCSQENGGSKVWSLSPDADCEDVRGRVELKNAVNGSDKYDDGDHQEQEHR
jgi:hypothetical protein